MNESLPFILHISLFRLLCVCVCHKLTQRVTDFSHTFAKLLCIYFVFSSVWLALENSLLVISCKFNQIYYSYCSTQICVWVSEVHWSQRIKEKNINIDNNSNRYTNFPVDESRTTISKTTHEIQCHVHKHTQTMARERICVMLIEYTKPFRFESVPALFA